MRNKAVRDKLSEINAEILGTNSDPFYGAPDVIAVFANSAATGTWIEDGSLAMGNLMNAAHAIGVASCWINRARQTFDSPEGRAMATAWGIPRARRASATASWATRTGTNPCRNPEKKISWCTLTKRLREC